LSNIIDNFKKSPVEIVDTIKLDPVVTKSLINVVFSIPFLVSIGLLLLGAGLIYYYNNNFCRFF